MPYSRPWTTSELNTLAVMYPRYGRHLDQWPIKIDRTERAIERQALRYGIRMRGVRPRMDAWRRDRLREGFAVLCDHAGMSKRDALHELNAMRYRGALSVTPRLKAGACNSPD